MTLININKLFFCLIFFFIYSCKSVELLKKDKNSELKYNHTKENIDKIDIKKIDYINFNYIDNYNSEIIKNNIDVRSIVKLKSLKSYGKKYDDINPLPHIFINKQLFLLDYKSEFSSYNLDKLNKQDSFKLDLNIKRDTSFPTSLIKIDNNLFASYSNGKLLSFNFDGKINWVKEFDNIIKTPLKVFNNSIILLTSNEIISIDPDNGDKYWNFKYEGEKLLNSKGGDIVSMNHLLFYILPNSKIGEINVIFGELNESIFSNINTINSFNQNSNKLHTYENYLSIFEKNKFLSTIDIKKNSFKMEKKEVINTNSFKFYNNVLFTLNNDKLLKAYNIINSNLFWETNLTDYLKKNVKIVNIINAPNNYINIFFSNGLILNLNPQNGEIIFDHNLKIKDIIKISFFGDYIIFDHNNGHATIYKQ